MTEFWKEHSREATVKEMMLDSRAHQLTQFELPEILSILPDLSQSNVLELGAGIGWAVRTVTVLPLRFEKTVSTLFIFCISKYPRRPSSHGHVVFCFLLFVLLFFFVVFFFLLSRDSDSRARVSAVATPATC